MESDAEMAVVMQRSPFASMTAGPQTERIGHLPKDLTMLSHHIPAWR